MFVEAAPADAGVAGSTDKAQCAAGTRKNNAAGNKMGLIGCRFRFRLHP
jgi:hypothetical protein